MEHLTYIDNLFYEQSLSSASSLFPNGVFLCLFIRIKVLFPHSKFMSNSSSYIDI